MTDLTLTQNLPLGWLARAEDAAADLEHAEKAPAPFKPEFVSRRRDDYDAAMSWMRFWSWSA